MAVEATPKVSTPVTPQAALEKNAAVPVKTEVTSTVVVTPSPEATPPEVGKNLNTVA